jgi:hypothetical protein
MARKTVLRRCSKAAPNSADIDALLARDDEAPDLPTLVELPAMEPEPQRQIESERQPDVSYLTIDADGEEHEYETPKAAEEALLLIFADAAKRNRGALDAAAENNGATIQTLGAERRDALLERYNELAADLDPFGLPPLDKEQEQASRDNKTPPAEHPGARGSAALADDEKRQGEPSPKSAPLLDGEDVSVPLAPRPTPAGLDYFGRQMLQMIAEKPLTAQRAARIKAHPINAKGIALLKDQNAALYDEVMRALNEKAAA